MWYLDGQEVGRGPDIGVENAGAGRHELRLEVEDRSGSGRANSTFEVRATSKEG